jgi:hypothetical protein
MEHDIPKATHSGILKIGKAEIPCYVLENEERILSTRGIMKSLGRTWRGRKYPGTQLPVFLEAKNLTPFISEHLETVLTPKIFKTDKGAISEGFNAEILPIVCETYLAARDKNKLTPAQETIARNCDILMRGFARVGIIALIDEATGYQYDRDRQALYKILEAYVAKELLPWAKKFPDEYYRELFRLRGWTYTPLSVARPVLVGKLTNILIYDRLPPGVKEELQRKNPKEHRTGRRKHKYFQFLTEDIGIPHLDKLLAVTIAFMKASSNWSKFMRLFNRAVPKPGTQQEFDYDEN